MLFICRRYQGTVLRNTMPAKIHSRQRPPPPSYLVQRNKTKAHISFKKYLFRFERFNFSYLQFRPVNLQRSFKIIGSSQFISQTNFSCGFSLIKFLHDLDIVSYSCSLCSLNLEQYTEKWISSSTSPESHRWQILWCGGIPRYLPDSISRWCADILNLVLRLNTVCFCIFMSAFEISLSYLVQEANNFYYSSNKDFYWNSCGKVIS